MTNYVNTSPGSLGYMRRKKNETEAEFKERLRQSALMSNTANDTDILWTPGGSQNAAAYYASISTMRESRANVAGLQTQLAAAPSMQIARSLGITLEPLPANATPAQMREWRAKAEMVIAEARRDAEKNVDKGFWGNLFDSRDDEKEVFGEGLWDGFLRALEGVTDTASAAITYGLSALPGGPRTALDWEEASSVSAGQMFATVAGGAFNTMRDSWLGETLRNVAINYAPALIAYDAISPVTSQMDIWNPQQRGDVYERWAPGIFASGMGDVALTWYADPLVVGGKAFKVARWVALDRPITSEAGLQRAVREVDEWNAARAANPDSASSGINTGMAAFMDYLMDPAVTARNISNHRVMTEATRGDELAAWIVHARDTGGADDVALVVKSAFGDAASLTALRDKNVVLWDQVTEASRDYQRARVLADPSGYEKTLKAARKAEEEAFDRFIGTSDLVARGQASDPLTLHRVWRQYMDKQGERIMVENLKRDLDPLSQSIRRMNGEIFTPVTVEAKRAAVDELLKQDRWLAHADDVAGTLITPGPTSALRAAFGRTSGRGIAAANRFGYMVEARRARRSITKGDFLDTTRATTAGRRIDGWQAWRKPLDGQDTLLPWHRRTASVWSYIPRKVGDASRWTMRENPSGMVTIKGVGALNMSKEVYANLDRVALYSGEPVKGVGGVQRKAQLMSDFMSRTGSDAENAAAVRWLEQQMMEDIATAYDMPLEVLMQVGVKVDDAKALMVKDIKDRGYFVDEQGDVHKVPWLTSNIENVHIFQPFEEIERRVLDAIKSGDYDPTVISGSLARKERAEKAYRVVMDVWRPLVLLRGGYLKRNVFEGLVRATLFHNSVQPFAYAAQQTARSTGSVLRKRYAKKNAARVGRASHQQPALVDEASLTRDGLVDVVDRITTLLNEGMFGNRYGRQQRVVGAPQPTMYRPGAEPVTDIAEAAGPALSRVDVFDADLVTFPHRDASGLFDELIETVDTLKGMVPPPKTRNSARWRDFDKWRGGVVNDLHGQMISDADMIRGMRDDVIDLLGKDELNDAEQMALVRVYQYLNMHAREIGSTYDEILRFGSDDAYALSKWKAVGDEMRTGYSRPVSGIDGAAGYQAFTDPNYAGIARENLSGDYTRRATLSTRLDAHQKLLDVQRRRHWTEVKYDRSAGYDSAVNDEYWNGLATQAQQLVSASSHRVLLDYTLSDEAVAAWVMSRDGRELRRLMASTDQPIKDMSDALNWTVMARGQIEYMFPDMELWSMMLRGKPTASELRAFYKEKDLADVMPDSVIGSIGETVGAPGVMEKYRVLTDKMFKAIGTIPENRLIREPFYGRRYAETMQTQLSIYMSQRGLEKATDIPLADVQRLMRASHGRALKDTKDWLYTIDRKTNVGRYMEYLFPFAGAAQNSFVALKRLAYRNPDGFARAMLVWNAPDSANLVDEDGNVTLPFWDLAKGNPVGRFLYGSVAQDPIVGVAWALNGDMKNMSSLMIPKSAVMSVFFEEETAIPLFGQPNFIVQMAASEMYKNGFMDWLGVTKDGGVNEFVSNLIFGPGRGPSEETASWNMFAPPWAQKLVSLLQGTLVDPDYGSARYASLVKRAFQVRKMEYMDAGSTVSDDQIMQEAQWQARALLFTQMLSNLTAFTPVRYETDFDPYVDILYTMREAAQQMGKEWWEADAEFAAMFGDEMLALGKMSTWSKSATLAQTTDTVAGLLNSDAIDAIGRSGVLVSNPEILGAFIPYDATGEYSPTAVAWLRTHNIPGTTTKYIEPQSVLESWEAQKINMGWNEYYNITEQVELIATQRGSTVAREQDLMDAKAAGVEALKQSNPTWYRDYYAGGSSGSTAATLQAMDVALRSGWDDGPDGLSSAAEMYLAGRDMFSARLQQSEFSTLTAIGNADLLGEWQSWRSNLAVQYPGWGPIQERYLRGDLQTLDEFPRMR